MTSMVQQLYKDQPSLNQVEILNISYEKGRKLLLNVILEEIFTMNIVSIIKDINIILQ